MALNLVKAVIGYLKEQPEEKFTARQIADWVFATFPTARPRRQRSRPPSPLALIGERPSCTLGRKPIRRCGPGC